MLISTEILRQQVAYTTWATGRLLEAASQLTEDELVRDFHTADQSVEGTLAHIFRANLLWLPRLQGVASPPLVTEGQTLAVLQAEWPVLQARWTEWIGKLDNTAAETEIFYTDSKGNYWRQPLWQLLLHVVNHDTHHRGQVTGFLRALGYTPPGLDLVAYYRSQM